MDLVPGDQLIARRYRLIRFIAQGGMGEVYEAHDELLGSRVALKMIRRDLLSRPVARERFKRETSLAMRVTHQNVCRIFDLGEHQDSRTGEALTFLTMEFLDGPTLESWLLDKGKLEAQEALPIALQLAAGLAAAHDAGVIHRDLKSANIMLVPSAPGTRVVITDFGLARSSLEEGIATGLTSIESAIGTPAYMSPEQAEGRPLTPASDLYSLGVVLFEMVTGIWPHRAPTPMAMLLRRIQDPPPSPRSVVPGLDPLWDAVILRCLEVSPSRRFPGGREVAAALEGRIPVWPGGREPSPAGHAASLARTVPGLNSSPVRLLRRRRTFALGATLSVVVVALVALAIWSRQRRPPGTVETRVKARQSIAILGFRNLSQKPDAAWLSTALSEMLTAELSAGGALRTVPGESVARMKRELSLPEAETLARETLTRVGELVGADFVLVGSYLAVPREPSEPLRLVVTLQDATTGETTRTFTQTGTVAEILTLVSRTGEELRRALGVTPPSSEESSQARSSFSHDPEALRLYSNGLSLLRAFDPRGARESLVQAARVDAGNPLVHAALAEAFSSLGYDQKARDAIQQAFALSATLGREERLFLEGRKAEIEGSWEKAIESYRTLYGFFPDNLDYGLKLASAQSRARRGKDALVTVESLRHLPAPSSLDPRIDLAELEAARELAEYRRAKLAGERAVERGRTSGARLLVAQGELRLVGILVRLGETSAAEVAGRAARKTFEETGDRVGEARSVDRLGAIAYEDGNYRQAQALFSEALALWRQTGNVTGTALALNDLASAHQVLGDLDRARLIYEELLKGSREMADPGMESLSLVNLGLVAYQRGELERARSLARQALAIGEQTGMKTVAAWARIAVGRADLAAGNLGAAIESFELARSWGMEHGDRAMESEGLQRLAEAARLSGRSKDARTFLEKARALRKAAGNRAALAESDLELALLALDEGKAAEALPLLQASVAAFQGGGIRDGEARASALLATALTHLERFPEARSALDRATTLLPGCQDVPMRLLTIASAARARAAAGGAAQVETDLGNGLSVARTTLDVVAECELRLALAAVERSSGRVADAGRSYAQLVAFATERKLGLFAAKAREEAALLPR